MYRCLNYTVFWCRLRSAILLVVMLMGMNSELYTVEVAEIEGGTGTAVASITVCHL